MTFTLDIKPLSVNEAWQGRRFSTAKKKQYEAALRWMLPKPQNLCGKYVRVEYRFFLKNFSLTDSANLEKVLTDCIVKRGIILDDRLIIDMRLRKFPTKANDRIEVDIEPAEMMSDWRTS